VILAKLATLASEERLTEFVLVGFEIVRRPGIGDIAEFEAINAVSIISRRNSLPRI
jgi:hypothetical protein